MLRENIIPAGDEAAGRPREGALPALARRLLLRRLGHIRHGRLVIEESGRRLAFGEQRPGEIAATVTVHDPRFWTELALGGNTGAGEAWIRGWWSSEGLTDVVRLLLRNREALGRLDDTGAWLTQPLLRTAHWLHRNTPGGSRRNIAAHYDLGNDFFALFLDASMSYSCGIFATRDATLEQAQTAKVDALCRKLDLGPRDHLLEIGTGWGGLAIHAARHYGCRVTTTTISREQHALATERVARAGLAGRVELLLEDYRDLDGRYDKLVSVEMIEAVGHQFLDAYLGQCSRLLEPEGLMALQAITIRDQLYGQAVKSVDFIKRYVFPGAFLPSVTAIAESVARATDLRIFHLQDIGPHYATTLAHWRRRFHARLDEVRAQGYPETFIRMWEFYLCYCEGGFLERNIGDVQMLLAKPLNRRPALGWT